MWPRPLTLGYTTYIRVSDGPAFPPPRPALCVGFGGGRSMKTASERMRQRLRKDRPMTVISLRIPDDVIEELKEIAPSLGFSGYQPLIDRKSTRLNSSHANISYAVF